MHLYNVPVIQVDLRHEETIIQTANAFEYLDRVIGEVFDKIDERIRHNNGRIDIINKRINAANNKINNLTGINKALTIFSPAKYPAASRSIEPAATFTYANRTDIKLGTDYQVRSRFDPIFHRDINNKLQFYHVTARARERDVTHTTHKRSLSMYLESIDTVLLFNETVNVYIDDGSERARRRDETKMASEQNANNNNKLSSAPSPIPMLHRKVGGKNKMHEMLFYSPGICEAPQIDVPHDLPDLPGIADDIAFNVAGLDDLTILPNPLNMNIIDLPAVPQAETEHVTVLDKREIIPNIPTPISGQSGTITSVDILQANTTTIAKQQALPPPPPPIPPPPPPPPPPVEVLANSSTSNNQKNNIKDSSATVVKGTAKPSSKNIQEDSGNMHNNLMAAIRQAGGAGKAKLRAAQLRAEKKVSFRLSLPNSIF